MHTRVNVLEGMQMKTILKMLGGIQSNYWGGNIPPIPPCFVTTASRTTVIKKILTTRSPGSPQINFANQFKCRTWVKLTFFFFLNVAISRPSSNLFMNVMQQLGQGLSYGTVPGPCAQMIRLFLIFTYIWQEDFAKTPKEPGA